MTTLTATRLATYPRVNLLPPEIEEQRRFRRLQAALGIALLGVVGVVGALTWSASNAVTDAQTELDAAQARGTQLQAQQAQFAEVPVVFAQVEAATAQLEQAMGQEVRWSYFLNDLSLRVPDDVWLSSMTVAQNVDVNPVATAAAPTDAYVATGLGTVTFTGQGKRHNDVATWLDALAKQASLTQPYFTSSAKDEIAVEDSIVTFSSTATITEEALSRRYAQKAGS